MVLLSVKTKGQALKLLVEQPQFWAVKLSFEFVLAEQEYHPFLVFPFALAVYL